MSEAIPPATEWPLYWFGKLEKAVQEGDYQTAAVAQSELSHLGVQVKFTTKRKDRNEFNQLLAMLDHTKISYGIRHDHNPTRNAVLIESPCDDGGFYVTEFSFDDEGKLKYASVSIGEEG